MQVIHTQIHGPESWQEKTNKHIHYIIFENIDNFIKLQKTELTDWFIKLDSTLLMNCSVGLTRVTLLSVCMETT